MAALRIIIVVVVVVVTILAGNALGASLPLETLETTATSSEQGLVGMAQRIAQCRELCYRQSLPVITPPFLCRSRPECYMCHDYCRVLVVVQQSLATSMCADREFCTRGCRVACTYHSIRIFQRPEVAASGNAVIKE